MTTTAQKVRADQVTAAHQKFQDALEQALVPLIRDYAYERYYSYSWDIVAMDWTDEQIASAIKGAKSRRGAIAKAWGVLQHIDVKRSPQSRPRKPISLLQFLASNGGIRSDDCMIEDLRCILDTTNYIPGYGKLIRDPLELSTAAKLGGVKAPLCLDGAREAAVEHGYLQDTQWGGGVSTSDIRDLLNAIDEEARGNKIWPHGEAPFNLPYDNREEEETCDAPF